MSLRDIENTLKEIYGIKINKDQITKLISGYKDILGLWIDKTESASFWSNVFEDLKKRGVEDILYMSSNIAYALKKGAKNIIAIFRAFI